MSYKKIISLFLLITCAALPARSSAVSVSDIFSGSNIAKVGTGVVVGLGLGYYILKKYILLPKPLHIETPETLQTEPDSEIEQLRNELQAEREKSQQLLELHCKIIPSFHFLLPLQALYKIIYKA